MMIRSWFLTVVITGAVLAVSCVAPAEQASPLAQPATPTFVPATATSVPATLTSAPAMATPVAATATSAPATATAASGTQWVNLDEIFPQGKGRDLVLNNCTSCHSFVCYVIGQRPVEHWETIKRGHRDKTPSLSSENYDALFAYLAENFNDTKPEPKLPQQLRDLGCVTQ